MTALNFAQAQALAGLMRDRDAQDAVALDVENRTLVVTLFDESGQVLGTGTITPSGCVREHATTA